MAEESVIYIFFLKKREIKRVSEYIPPYFGANIYGQTNEVHPVICCKSYYKGYWQKLFPHCFVVYSRKFREILVRAYAGNTALL